MSREMFAKDMFARELGIVVTEIDEGTAETTMTITEKMLNGVGVANGGAVFTLIDLALAAAANSGTKGVAMTMNVNINYCKPASVGSVVTAKAACISHNGKSTSCNVIATDDKGQVIAVAHGTSYETSMEK